MINPIRKDPPQVGGSLMGVRPVRKSPFCRDQRKMKAKNERLLQILQRPFSYRYGVLKIDISCIDMGQNAVWKIGKEYVWNLHICTSIQSIVCWTDQIK